MTSGMSWMADWFTYISYYIVVSTDKWAH